MSDVSGATIVEFAVVAPVFLGVLMFIFDIAYLVYARAQLTGLVNAVGRASTLETANDETRSDMDARLTEQMRELVPHGEVEFERVSFNNYGLAQARAEPFVDTNDSNDCDAGESFLDLNGNGRHDLDGARVGGGGARDVVIYTVTLTYDRLFPVSALIGLDPSVEVQAQTLLKNQPFDLQAQPTTRVCT
ncbi:TadE/TadG family type IV pilus assembly protein [Porphyrobacter sp. CACIAM 03H1]|uniref:TadE/TadG family type IV pilus assembly protein n=1 Tax=Porphyrobacter sp. CACIAM 03H1 TaxID=2003315 RepID=UPI0015619275|nr:TadE/TadG family type IV pilus assembly protein [Porphyrobacter sp. CACIAM 03H1]